MDTRRLKPLLAALDGGYRFRPHEMLGFFLSNMLSLWGFREWQVAPDAMRPQMTEAVEAYAAIVESSAPFEDVLGPVYMELASHGARQQLGQYFTPWPVASMMAMMTAGEQPDDNGELVRVCDPACGSGVMLLAFANHVLSSWGGQDGLNRIAVTGCDLDPYCARMMAVQLVANCNLFGLELGEILVLRGNSLLPDRDMETILHASAPSVGKVMPAQAPARMVALAQAAQARPDVHQYDLFAA